MSTIYLRLHCFKGIMCTRGLTHISSILCKCKFETGDWEIHLLSLMDFLDLDRRRSLNTLFGSSEKDWRRRFPGWGALIGEQNLSRVCVCHPLYQRVQCHCFHYHHLTRQGDGSPPILPVQRRGYRLVLKQWRTLHCVPASVFPLGRWA